MCVDRMVDFRNSSKTTNTHLHQLAKDARAIRIHLHNVLQPDGQRLVLSECLGRADREVHGVRICSQEEPPQGPDTNALGNLVGHLAGRSGVKDAVCDLQFAACGLLFAICNQNAAGLLPHFDMSLIWPAVQRKSGGMHHASIDAIWFFLRTKCEDEKGEMRSALNEPLGA